ncbi:hypothetical protein [Actinomadura macrotermitis]|uniref:Lipoprotein n=1 Tax=Actinomadura macrotermitis TaxID=2585200 RepID=A0A7K0BY89_9ACTN|nr:hypothetical protein [Actinomadura macrotermitis]MQY06147.1 hypothetical protein [Actinomadura macrotermitis]
MLRPIAATALILVLATGCGGGNDDGGGSGGKSGAPAPAASAGVPTAPVTTNGVTPGRAAPSKLDGMWTSGTVKLSFYRGAAALSTPNFCTGTVDAHNAITLTCADNSTARTSGKAVVRGSALTVTWAGGTVDKLTRKS